MSTQEAGFIAFLSSLASGRNRKPLAALKRSLAFAPGTYWPAFPYVEPFVGGSEGWAREAYYVVGGLFALFPTQLAGRTLARALAEQYREDGQRTLEQRFLALLDADRDQIVDRLRRVVALVGRDGLDWVQLLEHLQDWFRHDRAVQRRWAVEFYKTATPERTTEEAQP